MSSITKRGSIMNENRAMSSVGMSLSSTIRQDTGYSFSRGAKVRVSNRQHSPPPTTYTLPDSFPMDSTGQQIKPFRTSKQGRTVFSKEKRDIQFNNLLAPLEKITVPGPGAYAHYTAFNNDVKDWASRM